MKNILICLEKGFNLFFLLSVYISSLWNYTIVSLIEITLTKSLTLTLYIYRLTRSYTYESKCSYYDSSETIFNSLSHEHCI